MQEENENEKSNNVNHYEVENCETEDNEVGMIMYRGGQGIYEEDRDDLSDDSDTTIDDNMVRYKAEKVSVADFLNDNDQ